MSTIAIDTTAAGITVTPLQPTIGAEISGVDIARPITDAQREAIRAAVLKYKVIFFRDSPLTNEQHAAFAGQFGPLYTHPTTRHQSANNAIHSIAAADDREYGERFKRVLDSGDAYHTDTSWRLVPTWGRCCVT